MKKIIVPVDFTASSAAALRFASLLSVTTSLPMSVVFVQDTLVGYSRAVPAEQRRRERRQMEEQLARFVARHTADAGAAPEVKSCVVEGVAPIYVKFRSLDRDVALIVMGGAATGEGSQRDLFGGVASQTAKEGGCPVLLVPDNYDDHSMREMMSLLSGRRTSSEVSNERLSDYAFG